MMKPLYVLSLVIGLWLTAPAQDCAYLGSNQVWSVHETTIIKYCSLGSCATTVCSGDSTIVVTQSVCGISFQSDAVAPDTGEILPLDRSVSISCDEVYYTGRVGLDAAGVVYKTNWLYCSGKFKDGQIVFNCLGRATGIAGESAFTLETYGTSVWRDGPAQQAPKISQGITNRLVGLGSNITVTVNATGPCLWFQWYRDGIAIPGATKASLLLPRIRSSDAGGYAVLVHNFAGEAMSPETRLEVADLSPPTVAITAPSSGRRVTTGSLRIAGTAKDNVGVTGVMVSVNGSAVALASGTNRWSAEAILVPGYNVILVQAWDQAGNPSAPATRSVFYAVRSPLVVETDGAGRVQPNLNGRSLEIGRSYTMTAIPFSGWLAAGWSGAEETSGATLRFLHEENLALTAHFVPNPYPPLAGVYQGLFSEDPFIRPESSGSFALTLTGSGAFSGTLRNAGQIRSFTGRFDAWGNAHLTVGRIATGQWMLDLVLVFDDEVNQITGTISRSDWEATLLAERAVFNSRSNPAPFARRHTFLVQGATDPTLADAGDGFGAVTTTRSGSATLIGTFADNSAVTLATPLVRDGWWPLYKPLYAGRGCLFGWLQFQTDAPAGFGGSIEWIRPSNSNTVWYPGGFTNTVAITGATYVPPALRTDRVLALESGQAVFSGGPIESTFTNRFHLSARGVATNLSANKLSFTIRPASGLFSGSVWLPGTGTRTRFKGAVLQESQTGGGLTLGPIMNGRVTINPAP